MTKVEQLVAAVKLAHPERTDCQGLLNETTEKCIFPSTALSLP
jgi:hypothetical protein